jgi:hypothetical protein
MNSLIDLECTKSTEKSPIAFFISFYKAEKIKEAKESFLKILPNPLEETDPWNSFCTKVNLKKLEFSVEYFDEEIADDGLSIQRTPKIQNYSLKGELKTDQQLKDNREYLGDKVKELLLIYDKLDGNPIYRECLSECKGPIESLIRFIYKKFPEIAPDQRISKQLGKILKSSDKSKEFYQPYILSRDVIKKIIELKDHKGMTIFPFHDNEYAQKQLEYFFDNTFFKIKPAIHFQESAAAANFLISQLAYYLGYTLSDIQEAKIFKIKTGPFIAENCTKENSRLRFRNNNLLLCIKICIESSLS